MYNNMKKLTKSFLTLALLVLGALGVNAQEQVHASFDNPTNTNTTWDAATRTFTWTATYYNQLRNIGLPNGDISKYKKLVVDCDIKSGEKFRILFYKGSSNLTLWAESGVNEYNIVEELKAVSPSDYNEYILDCTEICLSGSNAVAPGEAVINDVYLETYPEGQGEEIPDIVYEEDPGMPEGDYVNFTEAFPSLTPKIGLGDDEHPIVLGNGEAVVGGRGTASVIADLAGYSELTIVATPGLKILLYLNHDGVEVKNGPADYTEEEEGKYDVVEAEAGEDGLYTLDLTQFAKQELNAICLPWDNSNKGTIWYLLLTESTDPMVLLKKSLADKIAEASLISPVGKSATSFATLTGAISDAQAVVDATDATEGAIYDAIDNLDDAIAGLTLAAGYANLTKDMFFLWNGTDDDATMVEKGWGNYEVGVASDLPYGDGSVSELKWADLTGFDKLIVATSGDIKPRFCLNRLEKDGQQAETQEDSKMLDINPNNAYTWSTEAYETIDEEASTYTIDLQKIVEYYGYARLHCIKKQGWGAGVVVTDLLLYKAQESVEVGEAGYATFSSLYPVKLDGVKGYVAEYNAETEQIDLTPVTEVPAGVAVIIEAAAGTYSLPIVEEAAEVSGVSDLQVSNGLAKGDGSIYVLANGMNGVGFYKLANDEKVPAGKAYLQVAAEGREFIGFGEATGIYSMHNAQSTMHNEVYNLQGQRVGNAQCSMHNAQLKPGLYIQNGKKVVKN